NNRPGTIHRRECNHARSGDRTAVVDWVLPLSEIAPHLTNLCQPVWK
ncbi:MAG: hypothetical protein HC899_34500, partial [Leptolyngbyaceae cyanobacterium SM1_4_3]|nr:hypothetical protein [Leptolyngbyaceae cyanobacterium SM1_4_3]